MRTIPTPINRMTLNPVYVNPNSNIAYNRKEQEREELFRKIRFWGSMIALALVTGYAAYRLIVSW